jgi:two-component system chemotaxis response regulator CheY
MLVMVVDDSNAMRTSISLTLKDMCFSVVDASSGEAALALLESDRSLRPKLFILDYNMEGMDGLALVRRLRGWPGHRFTPILILSREGGPDLREEARSSGASGWLVKPIASAALMKVIRQVCPQVDSMPPPRLASTPRAESPSKPASVPKR